MKGKKRFLSLLLSGVLLLSLCPPTVFAEAAQDGRAAGGLCEHHPQHTAECGYAVGSEGTPCNHEHTEGCYTLVTDCVHEHGPECCPAESVSGNMATPSEPEEQEPAACTHVCSEESGCITKKLDCQHEHDEACGYALATEGTPCAYVCEICNSQDSGETEETEPEAECICTELCVEDNINSACSVCGAANSDLALCLGMVPTAALATEEGSFTYTDTSDTNAGTTRTYTGGSGEKIEYANESTISNVVFNVVDTLAVTNSISVTGFYGPSMAFSSGRIEVGGDITSIAPITISGGHVTANSIKCTGLDAANASSSVSITGGIVEVTSEISSSSHNQTGATSEVTINGDTVVFASSIKNNNADVTPTKGVVFVGNTGTVYGSVSLPGDIEVPEGYTLTVPSGTSLTIPAGTTLTNNGTITVESGGTLTNNGTLENWGTITGAVTGTPATDGRYTINFAEETITISEGYEVYTAETGGTQIQSGSRITSYIGQTLYIQKADQGSSDRTAISIPARPQAPTVIATIDYTNEKISFPPSVTVSNLEYALSNTASDWKAVPSGAALSGMEWDGTGAKYYYFRTKASNSSFASSSTSSYVEAKARPSAPSFSPTVIKSEDTITISNIVSDQEYRIYPSNSDASEWETLSATDRSYTWENLQLGTQYTIETRTKADNNIYYKFASFPASITVTTLPSITTESLPNGVTGTSYSCELAAGVAEGKSVTWALVEGSTLPDGLTLNENGTISGMPTQAVTDHRFTIQATIEGVNGEKVSNTKELSITIGKGQHADPVAGEGYKINYTDETITAENGYELSATSGESVTGEDTLQVTPGQDVYIRFSGNNNYLASDWVTVDIPARPALSVTAANVSANGFTVKVAGAPEEAALTYQVTGGEGDSSYSEERTDGVFTDLKAGVTYKVSVECAATAGSFSAEATITVTTYGAKYTVSIPMEATAGGDPMSIAVTEDGEHPFELGRDGKINVKIRDDGNIANGFLTLTRKDTSDKVTSALSVDGNPFTDLNQNVATFTENGKDPVSILFAKPEESNIPAGTYTGIVNFTISYTQ